MPEIPQAPPQDATHPSTPFVRVRGAREHNLKNIDLTVPRDALVVFTGISGSGKSSLAFGTLFAESQRRYLDSVAPYARRLIDQAGVPEVDAISGLPPAVALQQQRGAQTTRSSVGSITAISNELRMLYSRAGDYAPGQALLYADAFSPNTPQGACVRCHGIGRVFDVTEKSMVPDDSLTIRERAIAAWPPAWHGQNLRDILVTLGYDIDTPWRELPESTRHWILFTDEQPEVPVYAGLTPAQTRQALQRGDPPSYMGTFSSARRYVLEAFATTQSARVKKRVARYMENAPCPDCSGKKLKPASLSVTFTGLDIADLSQFTLTALAERLHEATAPDNPQLRQRRREAPEKALVVERLCTDMLARIEALTALGLGYLTLDRTTPTLSPGELQRLRLATQLHSDLFGVVYVLDEPSAGLHPADTQALIRALDKLKRAGNSLFIVEHHPDVIRCADWLVDVGPDAGEHGGEILYSGPPEGLRDIENSHTRRHLYAPPSPAALKPRQPRAWLALADISCNNLRQLAVALPLGVLTTVTGLSGSGKSSLVSQALVSLVSEHLGQKKPPEEVPDEAQDLLDAAPQIPRGRIAEGAEHLRRLVVVDQKPIGRTPRSNLATYTGLFSHVRKAFAATDSARQRGYDAGHFSFNVAKGRCSHCEGEGFVSVELLFLPTVFAPCPTCHGQRYHSDILAIEYRGKNIAQVLDLTVASAYDFFVDMAPVARALTALLKVGLGYLRLGQPATELSGGEAQRIKLATELQRVQRGGTLYVLDEPTTGLHPEDTARLMAHLNTLVDAGNTLVVVEHNMRVAAASDWVIDMGPGAGSAGGQIVAEGTPCEVAKAANSCTAPFLQREIN